MNVQDRFSRTTPLIEASKKGNEIVLYCLINHRAEVKVQDKSDEMPLMSSCDNGSNKNIINCLIEHS